ncbi:hypothetical protein [Legionella sp. km772]|uniref:hypothetical protein n=1 Tax=Legionella sp. km772 TaxID=2498111 RepID=UPI000F8E4ADC|nr:hypothetical protein [Legionella sp. km772]RUR08705.1 hypothetical protein ELY15_10295 [Legionella sp. km772]
MPGFFSCFKACCDTDGDGEVSWKEVFMSLDNTIKFLNTTAQTLSMYSAVLEAAGVDMGKANDIFNRINMVLQTVDAGNEALKNIKITIANGGKVGDVNGDGQVNKDDVKLYFKAAQDVAQALAKAGVQSSEMADIQKRLQAMMDALDKVAQKSFAAPRPVATATM